MTAATNNTSHCKPPTPPTRTPSSVTMISLDGNTNHSKSDDSIMIDDLAPPAVTSSSSDRRASGTSRNSQRAFYQRNSRRSLLQRSGNCSTGESMRSMGEASLSSLDLDSFTLFNTSMCSSRDADGDSNCEEIITRDSNCDMSSVFSESTSSLLDYSDPVTNKSNHKFYSSNRRRSALVGSGKNHPRSRCSSTESMDSSFACLSISIHEQQEDEDGSATTRTTTRATTSPASSATGSDLGRPPLAA